MFTDQIERTDLSDERIQRGIRRAHQGRSAALFGLIKKAFNRDYDVMKGIDAAM